MIVFITIFNYNMISDRKFEQLTISQEVKYPFNYFQATYTKIEIPVISHARKLLIFSSSINQPGSRLHWERTSKKTCHPCHFNKSLNTFLHNVTIQFEFSSLSLTRILLNLFNTSRWSWRRRNWLGDKSSITWRTKQACIPIPILHNRFNIEPDLGEGRFSQ